MARVWPPRLASAWYDGTADGLAHQTAALLGGERQPFGERPAAIVVPHAAYQYSGATAAVAYRVVRGHDYQRVVILAPSHYCRYRGAALLDVDAFATPLGDIAVDQAAVRLLAGESLISDDVRPYHEEHSLEIQLPLLQQTLPSAAIVPLLVGDLDPADCAAFATILTRLSRGAETLVVISSDFTHYGTRFRYTPFPPRDVGSVQSRLRNLDMGAIDCLIAGDAARFRSYLSQTGATICGQVALNAMLAWFADSHAVRLPGELLAYTTSLDLTGDFEHSVSYAALAFAAA